MDPNDNLPRSGDDLFSEGRALKREIDRHAAASVERLLSFVERYAMSAEVKDEAALLQLQLGDSQQQVEPDIVNRMIALVESIIAEHSAEGTYDAHLERARLLIEMRERIQRMAPRHEEVFRGEGLRKRYADSGFELGPLSLSLRMGEITGVVGQNAHGKTTLLRMVAGELQADVGELAYPWLLQGGEHRIHWPTVKRHIAFVPQELPAWHGSLSDTLHYEAAMHGLYGEDNERAVSFIVQRLGLGHHLEKRWAHLSGGYKVRFALARALVWKPRLLVMDEPLANLDVKAKGVLLQDIRDLAHSYSHPIAVILSSHDLHNLESVCSKMLFLTDGQVRFWGDIRSIGVQRSRNEFEVGTSLSAAEARDRLGQSLVQQVSEVGLNLLLFTERKVSPVEVLQLLLERGVDVHYFRDNSTSIRSLFD